MTKQKQQTPIHPQTKATLQRSQPPKRTTIPTTTPRDPIHTIHPYITIRQFEQHYNTNTNAVLNPNNLTIIPKTPTTLIWMVIP